MSDNAVVILRRYGNLAAPRLVLSHGNGCAINGYFPYWRKLITDFEVVVFDFRNSGVNPVHDGAHGYARFLEDLTDIYNAIDREFGRKLQIGVFHSMSARANLKLALDGHSRLDGLIVFDPPMVPPTGHELFPMMLEEERMLCRWSAGRLDTFDDPSALASAYAGSRRLSSWVAGAYELMARSVLRLDKNIGRWRLVCSPQRESEVYRENAEMNFWPPADDFTMPVFLIGSDPDSDIPSLPAQACRALQEERGWDYECVSGTGHFLQLQRPEICADLTRQFVERLLR